MNHSPLRAMLGAAFAIATTTWSFSAQAAWKRVGPVVMREQGIIQVHAFQSDTKNFCYKLLDEQLDTVASRCVGLTTLRFDIQKPGVYYVQVSTNGFEDLQVVPAVKYQPVYNTGISGSIFRGRQTL